MGYAEVVRRLIEANETLNQAVKATQSAKDEPMFSRIMKVQETIRTIVEDCFVRGATAVQSGNNIKVV